MKASEIIKRSPKELEELLTSESAKLRDLTFRLAGAQLKEVSEVKKTKRLIARILTVMNLKKISK